MSYEHLHGHFGCYHCGHDQYKHNPIEGCPFCKCMATAGEAGNDPKGIYNDQRPLPDEAAPFYEWQRRCPKTDDGVCLIHTDNNPSCDYFFEEKQTVRGVIMEQYDAYLPSENLDPAWIAGWHAAVKHVASKVKS